MISINFKKKGFKMNRKLKLKSKKMIRNPKLFRI